MNIKTIKKGLHSIISPLQNLAYTGIKSSLNSFFVFDSVEQKPLRVEEFKATFDLELDIFFKKKRNELLTLVGVAENSVVIDLFDQAVLITQAGGKRIRPYIAYLSALSSVSSQKIAQENLIRSVMCLELFHAFALIHDDIIDMAEIRHGQKTVQSYFADQALQSSYTKDVSRGIRAGARIPHVGKSHAIMIGDLFFSMAHEAISIYVPREFRSEVLKYFNIMATEVVIGEIIDVDQTMYDEVSDASIRQKTDLKTARYTFVNPMKIGFVLGGANADFELISRFGHELGMAFQIKDDLLDITGAKEKVGKQTMIDIAEGQHTLFTQFVLEQSKIDEKDLFSFKSLLGKKERLGSDLTDSEKDFVKNLMNTSGAIDYGVSEIEGHITRAKQYLSLMQVKHQSQWLEIISLIENRSH